MKKYIKYIILLVLVIICIFLIWNTFIKKNPELDKLEKNITQQKEDKINNQDGNESNIPNDEVTISDNPSEIGTVKPIIGEDTVKPKDNSSVIISSETEMLNEKGEELLEELSKQLEQSFNTIESTTGVVDEGILDETKDINVGE